MPQVAVAVTGLLGLLAKRQLVVPCVARKVWYKWDKLGLVWNEVGTAASTPVNVTKAGVNTESLLHSQN